MILLRLFWEFFKTGLFSIGGGLATLPFLQRMGETTGWFTSADLANMVAISESTPGPIGINMASYVGYATAGIPGVIVATVGEVLPALVIIVIVAGFMRRFQDNRYVQDTLYGFRAASLGLIAAAFVSVLTMSLVKVELFRETGSFWGMFDWRTLVLAGVIWVLTNKTKWHPAWFLRGAAVVGVILKF
jgi:chromate transporter